MSKTLASLQRAAEDLEEYLHWREAKLDEVNPEQVMTLVHRISEAYFDWRFDNLRTEVVD